MKNAIIIFAFAALTGCASLKNAQYYWGYKDCAERVSGVFDYIEILENDAKGHYTRAWYEDRIRDLEMENAALKAANRELAKIECNATECTGIIKVRRTLARGQDEP